MRTPSSGVEDVTSRKHFLFKPRTVLRVRKSESELYDFRRETSAPEKSGSVSPDLVLGLFKFPALLRKKFLFPVRGITAQTEL